MNSPAPACPQTPPRSRRRTLFSVASGLLAGVLSVAGLSPLAAAPANAATLYAETVGPVDNTTGYPFWFGDENNLRLELCLDDPVNCPVVGELPDPAAPMSMPENFPDESFWWSAEALIDNGTVRARLVLAQEAAFGGPGDVAVGQQVAFSRLRIRIDDLTPNAEYHVVTPYGEYDVTADDRGRVFETTDNGCLSTPCDWKTATGTSTGPFLTWPDEDGDGTPDGAPAGFIGDPNVDHVVTGSPTGRNEFVVTGPGLGDGLQTNLFSVQGRIAQPRGTVDLPGDLYALGTEVEITPSFPGESEIVYTTDGSDPLTSETATTHESTNAAPNALVTLPTTPGTMTLNYIVRSGDQTSEVYTEEYEVRDGLSVVTATPAPAVEPDVLEGRQEVALSAAVTTVPEGGGDPVVTPTEGEIYFTTDGTRPRINASGDVLGSTKRYTGPITITRNTVLRAFSKPSADGTIAGPVSKFSYLIHNLRTVSTERSFGYPAALEDIGLPGANPGDPRVDQVNLELCLDDPLCPVVGELPDPTRGISFPDNFPDESFWWSGEAEVDDGAGERVRLVLALEAAFDTPTVQDGHQVAFGRIRVRYDGAVPGATYRVEHPYGVLTATADDGGRLFYTDDNGCLGGPCGDFKALLTQPVGPFLRWDPNVGPAAPAGYVGDPGIEHAVIGSPVGQNHFRLQQITDGDGDPISPQQVAFTDQFAVQGKLAGGPGVSANFRGRPDVNGALPFFTQELDVVLTGNAVTDEIRFTLDGTDPTDSATAEDYDGPIHIGDGTTTLRYVGVGAGRTTPPQTEVYQVDATAPTLSASPAGGTFTSARTVTLSSPDPTASIHFTTDGSTPTAESPVVANGGTVQISSSTTLRAVAIDPAGNASDLGSWQFTINTPAPGTPNGVSLAGPSVAVNATSAATLAGVLAPDREVLGGATVELQSRRVPVTSARTLPTADWSTEATATTGANGAFRFTVRPATTRQYRVVYQGDEGTFTSGIKLVRVRAVVGLNRTVSSVKRNRFMAVGGSFRPMLAGTKVSVRLDGPGRAARSMLATVNTKGTWRVTFRAPRQTGIWKVKAVRPGTSLLLGDVSVTRAFRIRR
jgi:hypothetical protein